MSQIRKRFVEDSIVPALNEQRYGCLLKWTNLKKELFSIKCTHMKGTKWSSGDTAVFQVRDKLKGHHSEIKGYFTVTKRCFRATVRKSKYIQKINCEIKNVTMYRLDLNPEKWKTYFIGTSKLMKPKKEIDLNQLRSLVLKHTSDYEKRHVTVNSSPSGSNCYNKVEKCIDDRQNKQNCQYSIHYKIGNTDINHSFKISLKNVSTLKNK